MSTATASAATLGRPHLSLTKRGRTVFTTLAAIPLVIAAMAFALSGGSAIATDTTFAGSFAYVTVEAGQSLWQIAETIAPKADPRDVVSAIVRLNQLPGATVQAGQQLAIPAEYSH